MSSVTKIVNKIYKTGINIEGLVNYFYQTAKTGKMFCSFVDNFYLCNGKIAHSLVKALR